MPIHSVSYHVSPGVQGSAGSKVCTYVSSGGSKEKKKKKEGRNILGSGLLAAVAMTAADARRDVSRGEIRHIQLSPCWQRAGVHAGIDLR